MATWHTRLPGFYGWWQVAVLFVILFFVGAYGFYVFPVFIGSLQSEFGWSMTQISASAGLFAIVFGLSGPVVGMMIARFGVRRTMLFAAALASLVNIGLASMTSLWMLYALNLAAGFVIAGTTLVPSQTVVTSWFDAYRGRAMAVALLGIGFGGMVLPPLHVWLIRTLGWRWAWGAGAVFIWIVIIPLIALFVRGTPAKLALEVDGGSTDGEPQRPSTGMTVPQAARTVAFPLLVGIYLLQLIGQSVLNFHFVPFATQQGGFTPERAAVFLGVAIGCSAAGKILFGWLADRTSPAVLMAAAGGLAALGCLVLETVVLRGQVDSALALWLYAVPYGLGYGGQIVLLPVLVGRCFGPLHYAKIQGLIMSGFAVGILVGVPLAGLVFDRTGSYELALIGALTAFVLSGVASLLVRAEAYRDRFASAE